MPAIVGPIFIRRVVDDSAAFLEMCLRFPRSARIPPEERAHFKQGTTD